MLRYHRRAVLPFVLLVFAAQAVGQDGQRPAGAPTAEATAERFLKEKQAMQARAVEELRAQGVAYGEVRSLLARFERLLRPNARVAGTRYANEINQAFLTDIAIELATLGYGPADLRDETQARRLFDAAANKRRAAASAADLALLAQAVVRGRVADYEYESPSGPSAIYLVLTVEDVAKGNLNAGDRIRIPLASRRVGDELFERDTSETLPSPGATVRAYLSRAASRFSGPNGRTRDAPDVYIKIANLEPS